MLVAYKETVYEYNDKYCDCCEKTIKYYYWSKHVKTKSHITASELYKAKQLIGGLLIQTVIAN